MSCSGRVAAGSLTLEVPDSGLHQVLAVVSVIEVEFLRRSQREPSIDNTIIKANHFQKPGIDKSLRKTPAFQMNIDNRTHWAVVADLHQEF